MKATGVIGHVIGLVIFIILILLLAGRGTAALPPPESSLELQPPARMGDGQALHPIESLLKVSPQDPRGDGQPPRRRRRHGSHFPLCSYCCNCCRNRGCGLCCRT